MQASPFDLPRYLADLALFQEMSADELQRLAAGCRLRRLDGGEMVFRIGECCNEFHVTVSGQVKLFVVSPAGQEKVIELMGPGQSFAEALMFTGRPYIINAQALGETLLLSVRKHAVLAEIERDPRFTLRMLAGMSLRLDNLLRDVAGYALHNGLQRVVGYLLRGHDPAAAPEPRGLTVALPVSMATIASRLSITPEYFSRVLHELEALGLIEIDRATIRIHDAARLAQHTLPSAVPRGGRPALDA